MTGLIEAEAVDVVDVTWRNAEIDGKKASTCDINETRLYVCERFGRVQAWVDGRKVGDFGSFKEAKAAAERHALTPKG